MVYQLNIQTIPLTRRSHLIVRLPVADTAAWVWSITGAVRRPRIRTACLSVAPAGMCFMPVTDPKTVKNRLHLDLASSAQDREQEIERLLASGARRAGIGQTGAESWTVLADREGNEFCVIRPKEAL